MSGWEKKREGWGYGTLVGIEEIVSEITILEV